MPSRRALQPPSRCWRSSSTGCFARIAARTTRLSRMIRAQAARIITTSFGHADMAADDRAYLVRMVMTRTGLAQPDAERRVTEVIAQARRAIRRARANAVILAFMAAASLLAGAAVAWYAAGFGGRHRDGEAMPAFWLQSSGRAVRGMP